MTLSPVHGEMGASIPSQDRRIAVRTTGKIGRRLISLLDRIRWRNESNLPVVENDAVVKSIEAFEVVVRRNWRFRICCDGEWWDQENTWGYSRRRRLKEISKRPADVIRLVWRSPGCRVGRGEGWVCDGRRGVREVRQVALIRFHDLCSIWT